MDKLRYATFNNVDFRFRQFNLPEIAEQIGIVPLLESWLEMFSVELFDCPETCTERLFSMIGMGGTVKMTSRHFVDGTGIAWPEDSFLVIENETDAESPCVLISPALK